MYSISELQSEKKPKPKTWPGDLPGTGNHPAGTSRDIAQLPSPASGCQTGGQTVLLGPRQVLIRQYGEFVLLILFLPLDPLTTKKFISLI